MDRQKEVRRNLIHSVSCNKLLILGYNCRLCNFFFVAQFFADAFIYEHFGKM